MVTLAALLALASTGAVAFVVGVLVGRVLSLREPPLREPVRPAEACVEEWAAEDVARPARLLDALQDRVHVDHGRLLAAKPIPAAKRKATT